MRAPTQPRAQSKTRATAGAPGGRSLIAALLTSACAGGPVAVAMSAGAVGDPSVVSDGHTGCTIVTAYLDTDGDGHGDAATAESVCAADVFGVDVGDDCNDGRADVFPGAPELCGTVDFDCDGIASGLGVCEYDLFAGASVALTGGAMIMVPDLTGDGEPDWMVTSSSWFEVVAGPVVSGLSDDLPTLGYKLPFMVSAGGWAAEADVTGDGIRDLWTVGDPDAWVTPHLWAGPFLEGKPPELVVDLIGVTGSVASHSDLTGDGIGDVWMGSSTGNQAYLLAGPITRDLDVANALVTIVDDIAEESWNNESFGEYVAVLGDLDGDGVDELVGQDVDPFSSEFGEPQAASTGDLVIVSAADRGAVHTAEALVVAGNSGPSIPLGDVDGDGFGDVAATACDYVVACVLYGPLVTGEFKDQVSTRLTLYGSAFNYAPATVGDLNGDGTKDLFLGLGPAGYAVTTGPALGTLDLRDAAHALVLAPDETYFGSIENSFHVIRPTIGMSELDGDGDGVIDLVYSGSIGGRPTVFPGTMLQL